MDWCPSAEAHVRLPKKIRCWRVRHDRSLSVHHDIPSPCRYHERPVGDRILQRSISTHQHRVMSSPPSNTTLPNSDLEAIPAEATAIETIHHELQQDEQPDESANSAKKKPLTAKQAAKLDPSTSTKACDQCGKPSDVLIRCRKDESEKWFLLCPGNCWKDASGGKVDGTPDTPWYRYGGVWKNKKAATSGKKPKHVPS